MQISYNKRFLSELTIILDFIARDSLERADDFYINLLKKFEDLEYMPYKYRQSNVSDDTNVRDLIFKGYIIPYHINTKEDMMTILGIYKENIWHFKQ